MRHTLERALWIEWRAFQKLRTELIIQNHTVVSRCYLRLSPWDSDTNTWVYTSRSTSLVRAQLRPVASLLLPGLRSEENFGGDFGLPPWRPTDGWRTAGGVTFANSKIQKPSAVVFGSCALRPPRVVFVKALCLVINSLTS